MNSSKVHGHVPRHLDQHVHQVILLEAGDDVVVLELPLGLGEPENVVGDPLCWVIVPILWEANNLSRNHPKCRVGNGVKLKQELLM